MDLLFLDANILFSAAYREKVGIYKFWTLAAVELITSQYAFEEAMRNLNPAQGERLSYLVKQVKIHSEYSDKVSIPSNIELRVKDRPILIVAIGAKANYLITGDFRDFGSFYGQCISGVTILPPASYLQTYYNRKVRT